MLNTSCFWYDNNIEGKGDSMPLNIHITDNKNEVLLTYIENEPLTPEIVMESLENAGVVYGVKTEYIEELCSSGEVIYDALIAEGILRVDGSDGTVEYKFSTVFHASPHVMDDGHVDFKDMDYAHSVKKGDVLAIKVPPIPGQDGINVFGEELKSKDGFDPPLLVGENCYLDEAGLKVFAEEAGLVKLEKGHICVSKFFEIEGNVGIETGNIDFPGEVVIHGNVITDFKVKCEGNLVIDGVVEAAEIYTEGDLFISKGIQGHQIAKIICKGNMTVGYINSADVEVSGDLEVGSLTSSNVICDGKMRVVGTKGRIIGGQIKTNFLEVKSIGTDLGVLTSIHLGMNSKELHELKALTEELIEINKELKKLTQLISILEDKLKRDGETEENLKLLEKSKHSYLKQKQLSKDHESKILKLKNMIRSRKGILSAGKISPDTRIMIGDQRISITDIIDNCIITKENGKIVVRSK